METIFVKREHLRHPCKKLSFKAFWLVASFLSLIFIIGCQNWKGESEPQGAIKAKLPIYSESKNTYEMKVVEIKTLKRIDRLEGKAAEFLMSPRLEGKSLAGINPRIQTMKTSEGVYIAKDDFSLQLLTMYYQFEKLMEADEAVGVSSFLKWPQKVAVKALMVDSNSNIESDNARYSGVLDAYLFSPYSQSELPLVVNSAVLAHEHFHAIFYAILTSKISSTDMSLHDFSYINFKPIEDLINGVFKEEMSEREYYHFVLLRGINEGLADAWGWLHTQDENFVQRSLPSVSGRSLKEKVNVEFTKETIKNLANQMRMTDKGVSLSYTLGTNFARKITQFAKSDQNKLELRKKIILGLKKFSKEFQELKEDQEMDPDKIIELIQNAEVVNENRI